MRKKLGFLAVALAVCALLSACSMFSDLFGGSSSNSNGGGNNGGTTTDPIVGLWKYTATGSSGTQLPVEEIVSISANGSGGYGMIMGSSPNYQGGAGLFTWTVSSGTYTFTNYSQPTSGTNAAPITSTGTLSNNNSTFTATGSGSTWVMNKQ